MNVIVCVKQIPDPALPQSLDPSTKTIKRGGKLILDESDSYGVEMALQLVGKAGGGEVSLVSMAPNGETSGMRTALAMGAAKGVLVSDPALQGTDALTTAKILAAAAQKCGEFDLIIAATESTDGYTGTVPEQMAEVLGLPSITFAKTVAIDGDQRVQRHRHLLCGQEVVAHRHRQRQVEHQHRRGLGHVLGALDLEVVGRQANGGAGTVALKRVADRAVQVEVERVAVLVRLGLVGALVTGAQAVQLVLTGLVLGELGEQVAQGVVADLAQSLRRQLQATFLLLDQAGVLQHLGQLGKTLQ